MIIRTKLATEEQKKLILEGRLTFFTLQRKQDLITDIDIKVLCTLQLQNPNYKIKKRLNILLCLKTQDITSALGIIKYGKLCMLNMLVSLTILFLRLGKPSGFIFA